MACSFFLAGGDDVELILSVDGIQEQEIDVSPGGKLPDKTQCTAFYVPPKKLPGELPKPVRHHGIKPLSMGTTALQPCTAGGRLSQDESLVPFRYEGLASHIFSQASAIICL